MGTKVSDNRKCDSLAKLPNYLPEFETPSSLKCGRFLDSQGDKACLLKKKNRAVSFGYKYGKAGSVIARTGLPLKKSAAVDPLAGSSGNKESIRHSWSTR